MQKQRYLYALVEGLSRRWRAPRAGVGGASVEAHAVRDLMLISGPVNLPPARTPRAEAAHHDVLAGLLDSQAVLPFRFGTVVPEPDLPKWLDTRWSRMRAAMSELRGHIEMSVRLLSLDHGRERGMAGKEPSGTVLRGVAERLVERANLPVWRYYPTGHGVNVAASLAFLVPSDEVPGPHRACCRASARRGRRTHGPVGRPLVRASARGARSDRGGTGVGPHGRGPCPACR
jgi:Gas vesicle synthesis protein GvpL/GvpF